MIGYIAPIAVITAGYALFQTANNTAVMTGVRPDQRGVLSGVLNLARNLGLITGTSVMGAVFALASEADDITTANPEAVATGMRITFAVAAALILAALAMAIGSRALARQASARSSAAFLVEAHRPAEETHSYSEDGSDNVAHESTPEAGIRAME
jgi:MFS family permease